MKRFSALLLAVFSLAASVPACATAEEPEVAVDSNALGAAPTITSIRSAELASAPLRDLAAGYEFKTESGEANASRFAIPGRDLALEPLSDGEAVALAKKAFNCMMDACDLVGRFRRVTDAVSTSALALPFHDGLAPADASKLESNLAVARNGVRVFSGQAAEGNDGPEFRRDVLILVDDANAQLLILIANEDLPLH